MQTKKKATASVDAPVVIAYKGFTKDLVCHPSGGKRQQYEVGKTYEHVGTVQACSSGFHACKNPMDVLSYYDVIDSRFCVVELSGALSRHADDSKIAAAKITIRAEIGLSTLIREAIKFVMDLCKSGTTETAASGDSSIAIAASTNCTASAGANGCIALVRWVESEKRFRVSVAYVGENGIKQNVLYQFDSIGNFVEVEQ